MAEKENPAINIGKNVVSGALGNLGKGLLTGKGASLSSMFGAALPFTALAGFVVPKLLKGIMADKPRITFSGVDPKYQIPDSPNDLRGYSEYPGKVKGKGGKSDKYDYVIAVKDTGKDEEIAQALIQQYDTAFDALAAQGVPVNEMLQRNQNIISTGRVDKGMSPEMMFTNVMTHFQPDVEAYKSGQAPPPREITVKPMSDPSKGKDNYDMGKIRSPYTVKIDGGAPTANSPQAQFNPQQYLDQNPDVVQGGYDKDTAYEHWDQFGRQENRPGAPLAAGDYAFQDAATAKNYLTSRKPEQIKQDLKSVGGTEKELASLANNAFQSSWTEQDVKNYLAQNPNKGIMDRKYQAAPASGLLAQQGPAHDWWDKR